MWLFDFLGLQVVIGIITFKQRDEPGAVSPPSSPLYRRHIDTPDADSPRSQLVDAPPAYQPGAGASLSQPTPESPETHAEAE